MTSTQLATIDRQVEQPITLAAIWQVDDASADMSMLQLWYRLRDQWLNMSNSQATRLAYTAATNQWLDYLAEHGIRPWAVTTDHVRAWQVHLAATGRSDTTINARLAACSSWYSFIINEKHMVNGIERSAFFDAAGQTRSNPFKTGNIRRAKVTLYGKANPLAAAELSQLFAYLQERQHCRSGARNFALLLTHFLTASRASEICRMRWSDIRPNRNQVDGHVFSWRGKGAKEEDTVLPARAYNAIIHYLTLDGRYLPGHDDHIQPGEYIWQPLTTLGDKNLAGYRGQPDDRHISAQNVQRIFKRSLRSAGIHEWEKYRVHDLRHSFAHLHYDTFKDVEALRRILHHESLNTTTIYIHQLNDPVDTHSESLYQQVFSI